MPILHILRGEKPLKSSAEKKFGAEIIFDPIWLPLLLAEISNDKKKKKESAKKKNL
jgi:hypothetical protein